MNGKFKINDQTKGIFEMMTKKENILNNNQIKGLFKLMTQLMEYLN